MNGCRWSSAGRTMNAGRWLAKHGEATYGTLDSFGGFPSCCGHVSRKGNIVHFWRHTWAGTEQELGGYETRLKSAACLTTGQSVRFEQDGYRILPRGLPVPCPEPDTQVVVFKLDFAEQPVFKWPPTVPAVVANG